MTVPSTLGEVCAIVMGQAPDGDSYNSDGVGLPLIAGAGDFGDVVPRATKYTSSPGKVCRSGDIVLGIRATIGRKVVANGDYCLGRGVAGLRPGPELDSRYLWHWLTHVEPTLASKGRGATFKQVNRNDIASLVLYLPPVVEQRRVAGLLDRADALRVKRRTEITYIDSLAQSVFIEMFGHPSQQSGRWPQRPVGDVANAQSGLTLSSARESLPLKVPYLRVANVYRGRLDLATIKEIGATPAEAAKTRLVAGDVLVVEGHGNREEVGRAAVWDGSVEGCVHQNHIIRLRFDPATVSPIYACFYLNSGSGRSHLLKSSKTTSGLNTISVGQLREMPITLPPAAEQREFARRVGAIAAVRKSQQRSSAQLDVLLASLQERAFTRQL